VPLHPLQIQRYVGRISGPLLDRIDIHIDVPAVRFRDPVEIHRQTLKTPLPFAGA